MPWDMRIPPSLATLLEHGVVEEVVRPLLSGKEAEVYVVVANGEPCVAKVYKEAEQRNFRQRAAYTEGRKTRNSRDARAMEKRSTYGRAKDEAAWRSTEVDTIYRLSQAGVRVPKPHHFIDGVLVMELVSDAHGHPAPRLGEVDLSAQEALAVYQRLLAEVVRMLCAGIVHGDLSDFNVLMAADGPVIIDFPQAVDAASNSNARRLLLRDVDNLHRFAQRLVPGHRRMSYAQEMWQLYERGELRPDHVLTGRYDAPTGQVRTDAVVDLIQDAARDAERRQGPPARERRSTGAGGSSTRGGRSSEGRGQSQPAGPRPEHVRQAPGHGPGPRPDRSQGRPRRPTEGQAGPGSGLRPGYPAGSRSDRRSAPPPAPPRPTAPRPAPAGERDTGAPREPGAAPRRRRRRRKPRGGPKGPPA
jgi:RIO kinase 1